MRQSRAQTSPRFASPGRRRWASLHVAATGMDMEGARQTPSNGLTGPGNGPPIGACVLGEAVSDTEVLMILCTPSYRFRYSVL